MVTKVLMDRLGEPWRQGKEKKLYLRGCFKFNEETMDVNTLEDKVCQFKTAEEWKKILKKSSGFFGLCYETDEYIVLATDIVRTYPMYYQIEDEIYVGDTVALNSKNTLDNIALNEMKCIGYALLNRTKYKDVKVLGAGDFVYISKNKKVADQKEYWTYLNRREELRDADAFVEKLDQKYIQAMKRAIKYANGRPIVLPLSGGLDSRIIAQLLYRLKYEPVICFSYGKKDNEESQISKKIAGYYGFKWLFIEYTKDKWYDFFHSSFYEKFGNYETQGVSIPHIQDILAVREMKEKNLIPENSVFMPGHSGDFVQGKVTPSMFFKSGKVTKKASLQELIGRHFRLYSLQSFTVKEQQQMFDDLDVIAEKFPPVQIGQDGNDILDYFLWKEQCTKLIVSSVKTYEMFGYFYWLPLWDKDLVDCWNEVPMVYKYGRRMHKYYLGKKQRELLEYLKIPPMDNLVNQQKMKKTDYLRHFAPILFRKLKLYLLHIRYRKNWRDSQLLWENMLSSEEFEKRVKNYTVINSLVSEDWAERLQKEK